MFFFSRRYRLLVALDIAKGMRYLHDHQLIHRDLRRYSFKFHPFECNGLSAENRSDTLTPLIISCSPNIFLAAISEGQSVLAKVGDFGLAQVGFLLLLLLLLILLA
jgi:serine/threonine protein kinase